MDRIGPLFAVTCGHVSTHRPRADTPRTAAVGRHPDSGRTRRPARRRGAHRAAVCEPTHRPGRARGVGTRPVRRVPTRPGYRLPPLMLSDDEALAVLLGLIAGRRAGLRTTERTASETATAKIRRVLPKHLARRLDTLLESLAFTDQPGEFAAPDAGVLLTLADAVRHRRPVSSDTPTATAGAANAPCTPTGSSPTRAGGTSRAPTPASARTAPSGSIASQTPEPCPARSRCPRVPARPSACCQVSPRRSTGTR